MASQTETASAGASASALMTDSQSWGLALSADLAITPVVNNPNIDYIPIKPVEHTFNKYRLLIGIHSDSAMPWWYLGATVTQVFQGSPSSDPSYANTVSAYGTRKIRLNEFTLVDFKDFGTGSYKLVIEFPHWLKDIHLRVFEYLGEYKADNSGDWDGGIQ